MSAKTAVELSPEQILEERKVKALEKIALSLDSLTIWFEEMDREGWDERLQFYLSEFRKLVPQDE